MAFDYVKPTELGQAFRDATTFVKPLHEPFAEYERIARNRPHPNIDKDLPKVTDGTLASIIQEKPKRIIQQIPTGTVECEDDNEVLETLAGFILQNIILPNAYEEAHFIQKCWAAVSKAMTYGSQPAFIKFINRGDYFGTDFVLPYIKDVLLEPGKISDKASNVIFLRTWWSENQIKALQAKEENLNKRSKDRGDNYESGWKMGMIAELLEKGPEQKDPNAQTPSEKGKQLNNGYYQIVHAFQRGIGGSFYSFSPQMEDKNNVLRQRTNPDPRGEMPIHFLYADQDLWNPLGRGAVEMSGGNQNLLDSEYQMYQWQRALMLRPPIKKKGNYSKSQIKMLPNQVWDLGSEEGNDAEVVQIDNTALSQFNNNVSLIQGQIFRLNQSGDTASIGSESGNIGMSKTPQGIKTRDAILGVSDNHMRKQFEGWFGEVAETMLNIWFAERKGAQELTVDDETAAKLNDLQPGSVNNQRQIRIDYDTETPKLCFKVDASSSNMKDNEAQVEAATELLELVGKFPQLDKRTGGPIDTIELADRIVAASGIENPEKIVAKAQPGQQDQQQVTPQMVQQMVQQGIQQSKEEEQRKTLFEQLKLTMADFPPDAQALIAQAILAEMGMNYQPHEPAPGAVDQAIKIHEAGLKAQSQQHQQSIEQANTTLKAVQLAQDHAKSGADTGIKMAQAAHQAGQAEQQQQLSRAQFAQGANEAQQSHDLAVKQSEQTQQPAGASA